MPIQVFLDCGYGLNENQPRNLTMKKLGLPILAWTAIWAFWLFATKSFHPTVLLAVIVTTSLVAAYAAAFYVNQCALIPMLLRRGSYIAYIGGLAITMMTLTAIALLIIRLAYFKTLGPDPDPYGTYKHYAIDLFGMAVHLLAGVGIGRFLACVTHRQQTADAFQSSNDPS